MAFPELSAALVGLTVRLLPRPARRRYREELGAELLDVDPGGRLRHAASLLVGAPRLRWDVLAALAGRRSSLLCYVGLHGRRVVHPNPEDHRVTAQRCPRCGRLRDSREYDEPSNADGVAWGGAFLSGGGF